MAVQTPRGKTFPGNFTIIPSSKKWVFHAIFHLAFLHLYTNDIFKSSKVMLCIYHAIWQPFKRDIYPLLPRKSAKGKPIELSTGGSQWGKLIFSLILSKCKMTLYLM